MPVYNVTLKKILEWNYVIRADSKTEVIQIAKELSIKEPPDYDYWDSSNTQESYLKEADNDEISS